MSLGHANREVVEALAAISADLLHRQRGNVNAVSCEGRKQEEEDAD